MKIFDDTLWIHWTINVDAIGQYVVDTSDDLLWIQRTKHCVYSAQFNIDKPDDILFIANALGNTLHIFIEIPSKANS